MSCVLWFSPLLVLLASFRCSNWLFFCCEVNCDWSLPPPADEALARAWNVVVRKFTIVHDSWHDGGGGVSFGWNKGVLDCWCVGVMVCAVEHPCQRCTQPSAMGRVRSISLHSTMQHGAMRDDLGES